MIDDRYVCVMADYSATGIWRKSGAMASLRSLPVDAETIFQLGQWQFWHDNRHSDNDILNLDHFVQFGWGLVWAIKHQLPDWTVVYWDEKHRQRLIAVRLWLS